LRERTTEEKKRKKTKKADRPGREGGRRPDREVRSNPLEKCLTGGKRKGKIKVIKGEVAGWKKDLGEPSSKEERTTKEGGGLRAKKAKVNWEFVPRASGGSIAEGKEIRKGRNVPWGGKSATRKVAQEREKSAT